MTLRVKVEVVPYGDEENAYEIGRLDIFNMGRIDPETDFCKYGVINLSPLNTGLYSDYVTHFRSDGAWALIVRAINELEIEGP